MECEECGAERWRPHGSYRTSNGERVRRWRCERCDHTLSDRAGKPSYGLRAGGQVVAGAPGGKLTRYLTFFVALARAGGMMNVSAAVGRARRWSGVSAATASRWIRDADLLKIGSRIEERLEPEQLSSPHLQPEQLSLPFPGDEYEFEQRIPRGERTLGWELAAAALRRYRERVPPEECHRLQSDPLPREAGLLDLLMRARLQAAYYRGEPVPSWLDRLAPGRDPLRAGGRPSRWLLAWREVAEPREFLRGAGCPEWMVKCFAPRNRRVRENDRVMLRECLIRDLVLEEVAGPDHRRDRNLDDVRYHPPRRWTRGGVLESILMRPRLGRWMRKRIENASLRAGQRESGFWQRWAVRWHRQLLKLRTWTAPGASRWVDVELDRPLHYWAWRADDRDHVAVSTDSRVLGHACRKQSASSEVLPSAWGEGERKELLPLERLEMSPWGWEEVSKVEIPWGGADGGCVETVPDEWAVVDLGRPTRSRPPGAAPPAAGRWKPEHWV